MFSKMYLKMERCSGEMSLVIHTPAWRFSELYPLVHSLGHVALPLAAIQQSFSPCEKTSTCVKSQLYTQCLNLILPTISVVYMRKQLHSRERKGCRAEQSGLNPIIVLALA